MQEGHLYYACFGFWCFVLLKITTAEKISNKSGQMDTNPTNKSPIQLQPFLNA